MGNSICPAACLINSSRLVHHYYDDDYDDDAAPMVTVLRTTDNQLFQFPGPVFVKDLMLRFHGFAVFLCSSPFQLRHYHNKPLHPDMQLHFSQIYYLKLWVETNVIHRDSGVNDVLLCKLPNMEAVNGPSLSHPFQGVLHLALDAQEKANISPASQLSQDSLPSSALKPLSSASLVKSKPSPQKALKKVRFADNVVYIGSAGVGQPLTVPLMSPNRLSNMNQVAFAGQDSSSMASVSTCTKTSGGMRLKVVISKKQLTELMSPKTSDEEADALMERMIAPMLSPTSSAHQSASISHKI